VLEVIHLFTVSSRRHQLSGTGSEAAILRIAASLADPAIPVRLARVLGSLDHHNIQLVTAAITRANG
jgi:hypothetical protein